MDCQKRWRYAYYHGDIGLHARDSSAMLILLMMARIAGNSPQGDRKKGRSRHLPTSTYLFLLQKI
jgi:hypothetical protein